MSEQPVLPIDPIPNNEDYWYWEAAEREEFLGQRCVDCKAFRQPPRPMCPHCHSLKRENVPLSGKGKVVSWVMPVHPHPFGYEQPPVVALVEVEEGFRVVTNLLGVELDQVTMDLPVAVEFQPTGGGKKLPVFRPVK